MARDGDSAVKKRGYIIMLLPVVLAAIVLLNLVSSYTFIHILLGSIIVWVMVRLIYMPRSTEELPEEHACH